MIDPDADTVIVYLDVPVFTVCVFVLAWGAVDILMTIGRALV